ncbi:MAG: hypothetical protein HUU50_04995 [Candidatus Brocadiae bacterium]|nr:hypothetical protein [Candidatus Brocadiia bacterium]
MLAIDDNLLIEGIRFTYKAVDESCRFRTIIKQLDLIDSLCLRELGSSFKILECAFKLYNMESKIRQLSLVENNLLQYIDIDTSSMTFSKDIDITEVMTYANFGLGFIYYNRNDYVSALKYTLLCFMYAPKLSMELLLPEFYKMALKDEVDRMVSQWYQKKIEEIEKIQEIKTDHKIGALLHGIVGFFVSLGIGFVVSSFLGTKVAKDVGCSCGDIFAKDSIKMWNDADKYHPIDKLSLIEAIKSQIDSKRLKFCIKIVKKIFYSNLLQQKNFNNSISQICQLNGDSGIMIKIFSESYNFLYENRKFNLVMRQLDSLSGQIDSLYLRDFKEVFKALDDATMTLNFESKNSRLSFAENSLLKYTDIDISLDNYEDTNFSKLIAYANFGLSYIAYQRRDYTLALKYVLLSFIFDPELSMNVLLKEFYDSVFKEKVEKKVHDWLITEESARISNSFYTEKKTLSFLEIGRKSVKLVNKAFGHFLIVIGIIVSIAFLSLLMTFLISPLDFDRMLFIGFIGVVIIGLCLGKGFQLISNNDDNHQPCQQSIKIKKQEDQDRKREILKDLELEIPLKRIEFCRQIVKKML